jgi:virulence-associated protein VapD
VELRSLLNNAHSGTFKALSDIRTTVPVLEFHCDNGSAFINHATEIWGTQEKLSFSLSHHYKNDKCFVEQKNDAVVRE